jgi:hypothetical protein
MAIARAAARRAAGRRRADDADAARNHFRRAVVAESLRQDQHARPERLDGDLAHQALVEVERVLDDDAADARLEQRLQRQLVAPVGERHDDERRVQAADDLGERIARPEPAVVSGEPDAGSWSSTVPATV